MGYIALIRVGTVLLIVVSWELLGRSGLVLSEIFPPASEIFIRLFELLVSGTLGTHAYVSLYEIFAGFMVGGLLGLTVGASMGASPYLHRLFEPLVYYLGSVPKIILFPVFILFLGTGLESKIGLAAIAAFFPITINTALAVGEVKPIFVRAARTLEASRLQLYSKVYLPSMAGPILSGMRLGLGVSIIAALLAETSVAQVGLGFLMIEFYSQLRIAEMYALILLIFIAAFAVNSGISWLISKVTHYEQKGAQTSAL